MALDPVPWFVGAGARHSAASARNLAWNATGGKTGISTPTSLEVRATSTASNSVQIMPGGAVIESTYQGALQQSYTVRNASATNVAIPANTGSSARTYYITAEINDPTYAGSNPPSIEEGPYNFFRARTSRQSVHPEVLLAKVKVRPNSPILSGDITDMREVANPKRETIVFARPRIAADSSNQNYLNGREANGGEYFPGGGGYANEVKATVPEWAVSMIIEADWMAVGYKGGESVLGRFWVAYGDEYRDHTWPNNLQWEYRTQEFRFNAPTAGNDIRTNWRLMDTRQIASKFRGKEITFAFIGAITAGSPTNAVYMDSLSGLGLKVTFLEERADWEEFNAA